VLIRPRVEQDLDSCEQLARAVHQVDGYPPRRADNLRAFISSAGALGAWVAEIDECLVGHVALNADSSPEVVALAASTMGCSTGELGVVARLLVHPESRRQGLGAALLITAADAARERGLWPVLDVASHFDGAMRLYERSGWVRVGTVTAHIPGDDPLEEVVYRAPH
jgi:GNAT superfamily N-acetyltransferase